MYETYHHTLCMVVNFDIIKKELPIHFPQSFLNVYSTVFIMKTPEYLTYVENMFSVIT